MRIERFEDIEACLRLHVRVRTQTGATPSEYRVDQNYPNPFNSSTTIRFSLPEDGLVKLTIYSLTGEKITTLKNGFMEKGFHQVEWNGQNKFGNPVASWIYIYELKAGNRRLVNKMLLAK